jgi:large subunit ribosomal protein L3
MGFFVWSLDLMKLGLFGKKLGMTHIFDAESLRQIPVTVVQVYAARVLSHHLSERDGYNALVIGFGEIAEKRLNKANAGVFKKLNAPMFRYIKELRVNDPSLYPVGTLISVEGFASGDGVHAVGISKGKGFQGVIKRHGKSGGPMAHGSGFHRTTGSIGQRTYPGKVFKNMGMAGRMGGERVKTKNLKVVGVDAANSLVFVRGAVPGARDGLVFIEAKKNRFETGVAVPAAAAEGAS